MTKVQLFYDDDLIALELKINDWLSQHRDISILESNLSSLGKPSQRAGIVTTEKYVFYILYKITINEDVVMRHITEEQIITPPAPPEVDISTLGIVIQGLS